MSSYDSEDEFYNDKDYLCECGAGTYDYKEIIGCAECKATFIDCHTTCHSRHMYEKHPKKCSVCNNNMAGKSRWE